MKVHQIMTAHARCVGPDNTLVEAAGLMRELDVGALPVCEDNRLSGIVTDRDIALRGVANGCDPNTTAVREVMSTGVMYAFADQEVEDAVRLMEERQIRRVPILNREKRLVGIVSLGDVATSSNPAFSGTALRDVSQPANPSTRQQRLRQGALDMVPPKRAVEQEQPALREPAEKRPRRSAASARRKPVKRKAAAGRQGGKRKPASARGRKTSTRARR